MTISQRLHDIQNRVNEAAKRCGRSPEDITLIAVSKTFPADRLQEAIEGGALHLGENRPLEAAEKKPQVNGMATWHLIGPMQSRKIKELPGVFDVVHTVHREKELRALDQHFGEAGRPVKILIQVNVGGEHQKSGVEPKKLWALLESVAQFEHLTPVGLMTIPPFHEEAEDERRYYIALRELKDEAFERGYAWCKELSMGMSHDFEVAIEEGATMVRVGSAIFGPRTDFTGTQAASST